ncbi:MAG: Gx transporter family protein [Erysipelothrix sp.]|nr:Gx transporter family protein [Erysipelothrix sp.]
MNRRKRVRRLMILTMLLAMSIVFHMLEPSLPLPIPGVKLGLANILGLIALYMFGWREMLSINFGRVLIASLLRGIIFGTGFWLSLSGVALSSLTVIILKKFTPLSAIGLSVASATFHNVGQILAIVIIWSSIMMVYWLPVMIWMSIPTGILTGTLAVAVLKRISKGGSP